MDRHWCQTPNPRGPRPSVTLLSQSAWIPESSPTSREEPPAEDQPFRPVSPRWTVHVQPLSPAVCVAHPPQGSELPVAKSSSACTLPSQVLTARASATRGRLCRHPEWTATRIRLHHTPLVVFLS